MAVVAGLVVRPLSHGAVGWWDELLNLLPPVIGSGLLIYLYTRSLARRGAKDQPAAGLTQTAGPVEAPAAQAQSGEQQGL